MNKEETSKEVYATEPRTIKTSTQIRDDDILMPSDGLMVLVAMALKQLSEAPNEEMSVQVTAWMYYINICSIDMTFEQLLHDDPHLASYALAAIQEFDLPDDDPVTASDCWYIEHELCKILDSSQK
jgi:hypothetical protein